MTRLTRDALRGRAQTVLGLIDPAELGPTLMHEHLIWDIRTPAMRADPDQGPDITLCNCFAINYGRKRKVPGNLRFRCEPTALAELALMRQAGGRTMVERPAAASTDPGFAGWPPINLNIVMAAATTSINPRPRPPPRAARMISRAKTSTRCSSAPGGRMCAPASLVKSAAKPPGPRRNSA